MNTGAIGSDFGGNNIDKIKKMKQFYNALKTDPQTAASVFGQMVTGNINDLPKLLSNPNALSTSQ